jgi:hypothetical protein
MTPVDGDARGDDMQRLNEEQWQSLASSVERVMTRLVPDWTSHNTHDPGITVLELLSYALIELQYRSTTIDANGRALARQVARLADSLAGVTGTDDCPPGLQRVNYFYGKLLGVDDFTAEQDYILHKTHRRNRALHGAGIVTGLGVTLERTGSKAQVVIASGLAFNPGGKEIEVCAPVSLLLPAQGKSLLVLLNYAERPCRPVPAPAMDPQADTQARFSRITETFGATLAPATDDTAVALARVNFNRGRWALDRSFRAAKVTA